MTNIQFLKDRIIIDGHAETKQECETITLLCDNLAKSKDFKTVRYESGYAEFEKVGATNGLMFAPAKGSVTIIFDSHITKIDYIVAASSSLPEVTGTLTSSGQSIDTTESFTLNCTLQAGYVIDTVTWSAYEPDYGDSMSHTDTSVSCYSPGAVQETITITTKQSGSSTGLTWLINDTPLMTPFTASKSIHIRFKSNNTNYTYIGFQDTGMPGIKGVIIDYSSPQKFVYDPSQQPAWENEA